jgi:hypothetical protein
MSNALHILCSLDSRLNAPVELTLYGPAPGICHQQGRGRDLLAWKVDPAAREMACGRLLAQGDDLESREAGKVAVEREQT